MTSSRTSLISSIAIAAALLGACGGNDDDAADDGASAPVTEDDTATEATAGDDLVTMEDSRYSPQVLEVSAGTEVTFENTDPFDHTVTSVDGSPLEFDSGELGQDETFTQTFDEAGTYEYFCQIHPTMGAEIVVS